MGSEGYWKHLTPGKDSLCRGAAQNAQRQDHAPATARSCKHRQSRGRHLDAGRLQRDFAADPARERRRRNSGGEEIIALSTEGTGYFRCCPAGREGLPVPAIIFSFHLDTGPELVLNIP